MYIGRIGLKGFKSFGGSHEIALSGNFTAVVGPNGSGKSNILDALRWVLGDGNPGRLRIVRQGDLLFQGSISLPPASVSEVTVNLRNGDRVCTLRRRYSQEEGSTTIHDGSRIRLLDLENVKREWHLEGDRFAFISQGEVSEMIQQKPLHRRMHLESIFGIDLYRKQREEADQRLDTASSEMQRIMTLRSELQIRKDSIAEMVVRAREAKSLMDLLERERCLLYWARRARSEKLLEAIRAEIEALEFQKRASSFWSSGWAKARSRMEVRINDLSGSRGGKVSAVSDLERRIGEARKGLFSLSSSLRGTIERRYSLAGDLAGERERLAGTVLKLEGLEEQARKASEEEGSASEVFRAAMKDWDRYQSTVEKNADMIRAVREEKAACETALGETISRSRSLGRSLIEISGEASRAALSVKGSEERIAGLNDAVAEARAEEEKAASRQRDLYASCQKAAADFQKMTRELSMLDGEIDTLRDSAFSKVYPPSVQHLMSAVRLGRIDASPRPLAEVITCPERLTTAIESFLGARQFLLLVRDIDEAGRCIAHLKARSAGRATFLPLESARRRTPSRGVPVDRPGVVGWAADLVGMEKEWEECVLHVLGDLLIVESFDVARDLSRGGFRGPAVTLEGDVFQPGGTISGGKSSRDQGAIELKRRLSEKEAAAGSIRSERSELEKEIALLEEEERLASERSRLLFDKRRGLEEEIRALESAKAEAERDVSRYEERRKELLSELSRCGRMYLENRTRLETLSGEGPVSDETASEVELVKDLEEKRSRAEVAAGRHETARRMVSLVREEENRSSERIRALEESLQEVALAEASLRERLSEGGRTYFDIWKNLRLEVSMLEGFENTFSRALASRDRVTGRAASAAARAENLEERIRQARQRMESTETEMAESFDMWEERFPYPGGNEIDTRDYDRIRRNVRDLEKGLREIGDVDIGVLSEDSSLAERLAFLEDQLQDVATGIDELRKLIEETDKQAGALFSASLKEIDRKFCSLFQRLFGGGEAHLRLSDEDDLWAAGVEVIARPPGKRPQHLAQLSGGEQSLSAISLLFASMEVAGVPLAVLDEVDASLDEVNLRRFSDLAKEYSRTMQLICMTHRRATMERADIMYGVTMSEPGLSQVVGVRVEDWE